MMNEIFKIIDPQANWLLTQMSNSDLQDFLALVNKYPLEFRDTLALNKSLTFGLEIECERLLLKRARKIVREKNIRYHLDSENNWQVTTDLSLKGGCEVTSPILNDSEFSWHQIYEVCKDLQRFAKIKTQAGAHIHIGAHVLDDDGQKLWQFIQLWLAYENIIYRFGYGEFLTARPNIQNYAYPIAKILQTHYEFFQNLGNHDASVNELFYYLFLLLHRQVHHQTGRNKALNFNNVVDFHSHLYMNTIEFRSPNGTLNPIIWQNNVNLFANMLTNRELFQPDLVAARIEANKDKYQELFTYQEINLPQAIEFCDLVFAHNIDKVYFLRQYLKNSEVAPASIKLVKAKPFTSRLK